MTHWVENEPYEPLHVYSFGSLIEAFRYAWRQASISRRKWRVWQESEELSGDCAVVRVIRTWCAEEIS